MTTIENYEVEARLKSFYQGGPVVLVSETALFCLNGPDLVLMDPTTGLTTCTLEVDGAVCTALAVTPDGTRIAVATRALHAHIVALETLDNTPSMRLVTTIRATRTPFCALALSEDGTLLAAGSSDGKVRLFAAPKLGASKQLTSSQAHEGIISAMQMQTQADGSVLVYSIGADGAVAATSLSGELQRQTIYDGPATSLFVASYVPNTERPGNGDAPERAGQSVLYVSGRTGAVTAVDMTTLETIHTVRCYDGIEGAFPVSVEQAKAMAAAGGFEGGVEDLMAAFAAGTRVSGTTGPAPAEDAYLPPWLLATAGASSALCLVHPYFGRSRPFAVAHRLHARADGTQALQEAAAEVSVLEIPTYTSAASMCSTAVLTSTRDVIYLLPLTPAPARALFGHLGEVSALVATDRFVVAAGPDGTRSYNRKTGAAYELVGHSAAVTAAAVVNVDDAVVVVTGAKDTTCRLWLPALPGCPCIAETPGVGAAVTAVAPVICGDLAWLFVGSSDGFIRVFDIRPALTAASAPPSTPLMLPPFSGAVHAHPKATVESLDARNDGRVLSAGSDKRICIHHWGSATFTSLATGAGHRRAVYDATFAPSGRHVASASADGTVRVWSAADLSTVRVLEGHAAAVFAVRWVSDGRQLVSAGGDGTVRVWTVQSGAAAGGVTVSESRVWCLSVPGDGDVVFTGDADGEICRLRDATEVTKAQAAAKAAEEAGAVAEYEQALADKDWPRALRVALKAGHMRRAKQVIMSAQAEGAEAIASLGKGIADLAVDADLSLIRRYIEYVDTWNQSARTAPDGQAALSLLLTSVPIDYLFIHVPGAADLLASIRSSTQRHYERVQRLRRATAVVDLALAVAAGTRAAEAELAVEKIDLEEPAAPVISLFDEGPGNEPQDAAALEELLMMQLLGNEE